MSEPPRRRVELLLAALVFLSACSGSEERRPIDPMAGLPSFVPEKPIAPMTSVKSVARPEPMLLPGDLLFITVFRQPDLDRELRIPKDGKIPFPLIGSVQAAGKTQADVEQIIRKKLEADYLREASVTVTVKEYAKRWVFVVGGVTKPDAYELAFNSRMTILQLVAHAGGFTDRAYKEYVQLVRRYGPDDRKVISLSLVEVEKELAKGEPEADLELWPDDLVVIPSALRVAFVLGAVSKPGNVDVPNGARMTVSMAVSAAGSYTKFAATGRVQVLRHALNGEVRKISVDLDSVLGGRMDLDIELQPGDVVWVPERGIFQ